MSRPTDAEVLRDLARAKALFQQRAIMAVINDRPAAPQEDKTDE